jgi:hypothetical protein
MIIDDLKKRLHDENYKKGGKWIHELWHVIWGLRTQPSKATGQTPFFLVYGSEAILPADIVAEPSELFRLKCASHRHLVDTNSAHFKRNNPLVCRVSARYNHGSTRSKQVYLARWRVYNHSTAPQLLIYRYANNITNLVQA